MSALEVMLSARAAAPVARDCCVLRVVGQRRRVTDAARHVLERRAMRGRIAGTYAFFVIVGDMMVQAVATPVSESLGIPSMLLRVGLLQVAWW